MKNYTVNKMDILAALFWIMIMGFYTPYQAIYYVYQATIAIEIFIVAFSEVKGAIKNGIILLYPCGIVISCVLNKNNILYTQMIRGFVYALIILDIFLFLNKFVKKRGSDRLITIFYDMSLLYFIISVVWIIVLAVSNKLEFAIQNEQLFLGGKFPTVYCFIFFLMFFCLHWSGNKVFHYKIKKYLFIILSILCIVLSYILKASTGIVAIAFFSISVLFLDKLIKIISNPVIAIIAMSISMGVIFALNAILALPIVQTLIVKILHEDLGLTGRMRLYTLLYSLFVKAGIFGNGFGSYVTTSLEYHGWANAQNGLAEIVLTYGWWGAISLLAIVFNRLRQRKVELAPLNAALLTFIMVAVVEIPYDAKFILLIMLFGVINSRKVEIKSKFPRIFRIKRGK